jgi:hypothetical protein
LIYYTIKYIVLLDISIKMAIDIKKTENGILIENKFLFNPTEIEV